MKEQLKSTSEHTRQGVLDRVRERIRGKREVGLKNNDRRDDEKNTKSTPQKQSKEEKITLKTTPKRLIEQIFIGAWNAAKPESQGKAIMKLYDKYFIPKYKTKEEAAAAKKIRPKVEKIVGLTAIGIEAGIVTFGVVKGYNYLKKRRRRAVFHNSAFPKRTSQVSETPVWSEALPLRDAQAEILTMIAISAAMIHMNTEAHSLGEYTAQLLDKCALSADLQKRIQRGFVQRLVRELGDPEKIKALNEKSAYDQAEALKTIMDNVVTRWMAFESGGETQRSHSGMVTFGSESLFEIMDYLRVIRAWYAHVGFPGIDHLGIVLKPRRSRKIAGK